MLELLVRLVLAEIWAHQDRRVLLGQAVHLDFLVRVDQAELPVLQVLLVQLELLVQQGGQAEQGRQDYRDFQEQPEPPDRPGPLVHQALSERQVLQELLDPLVQQVLPGLVERLVLQETKALREQVEHPELLGLVALLVHQVSREEPVLWEVQELPVK